MSQLSGPTLIQHRDGVRFVTRPDHQQFARVSADRRNDGFEYGSDVGWRLKHFRD